MLRVVVFLIALIVGGNATVLATDTDSPLSVFNKVNHNDPVSHAGNSTVLEVSKKYELTTRWSRDRLWCARYVNIVLKESGIKGTGSAWGRSFLHWGIDTTNNPRPGDVVVLSRGKTGSHVGFFVSRSGSTVVLHSGNTRSVGSRVRTVATNEYPASRILSIRRAITNEQIASLF